MEQSAFWSEIAQAALNFIVVNALTSSAQKATVTDLKTDLRTTKEDIMAEFKETTSGLSSQVNSLQAGQSIQNIVKAEKEKETKKETQ